MAPDSPDDPLDRLLRRSLGADDQVRPDVCPAPDLLAAFGDGRLDRRERQRIERHASTCARCARVLALAAAADPAPTAAAGTSGSIWRAWRWAVPVATAATVAGLLIVNGREQVERAGAPPASDARSSRPADAARQQEAVAPRTPETQIEAQGEGRLGQTRKTAPLPEPPSLEAPAAVSPSEAAAGERPAADAVAEERRNAVAQAPVVPPAGRERAEAAAASPAASALADEAQAGRDSREVVAPALEGLVARAAAPALVVRSPAGSTQWRLSGTLVERSTDGGTTWRTDYTAARQVLGGAAVSEDVAWFYGADGLVLRRTPAGWSVVPAPAPGDIGSMRADSADVAFVVLENGRQFFTTNGGQSWAQQ